MQWLKGRRQLWIIPPNMKAAFMARTAIMGYVLGSLIGSRHRDVTCHTRTLAAPGARWHGKLKATQAEKRLRELVGCGRAKEALERLVG